jgi:type II secretory pathway pseudopilin PulG
MRKALYTLGEKRRVSPSTARLRRRLIALGLLLCVMSYLFWSMGLMNEKTRIKQALLDISRIQHAARIFRADHGRCPDNLDELVSPPGPGKIKYLTGYDDPWGKPYKLICPARLDPGGVEVLSGGPDRSFLGNDTISSL